ncbi:MAG: glutathione peroxidase [Bacteroidia bacterium]|nr:glutathione peroxidase [Bacteroidia bacterium]MDW8158044.1 glutathione peroxidase [Bacteroidia bacterium]
MNIYDFTMLTIDGKPQALSEYKGKVLLLVNVASKCGLTPQYADLELFYEQYKDKGVEVLGFPANNFANQEPGSNEEIYAFCTSQYGVTFPMFAKISVKGEDIHPLYAYLTEATKTPVQWNFQKYLVNRAGDQIKVFEPTTKVSDPDFLSAVEAWV